MTNDMKALISQRVVTPTAVRPAAVCFANGRITAITSPSDAPNGYERVEVGRLVIMPGVVDVHVHINEPGRTHWEGFATATRAAAAGGITTVVDMPLNSDPVTTTLEALAAKKSAAQGQLWVNCAFHAGVVSGQLGQLAELLAEGCVAGKAFMVYSGIPEFGAADEAVLREAMQILARAGRPLLAHAEVDWPETAAPPPPWREYASYLASRPPSWEVEAIRLLIKLCRETGCATHIVHLATAEAFPLLRAARAEGLPITVETAPHYLHFCAEEIGVGETQYKCAPPIREATNRESLWQALLAGEIDLIASDHSPCPPVLKGRERGDFAAAWGGIAGLQWLLPVVWSGLRGRRGALGENEALLRLVDWLCAAPAKLVGMGERGRLEVGAAADIIIWDPDAAFEVTPATTYHRHKQTPYLGETLHGLVTRTYVGGELVYRHGRWERREEGRETERLKD